MKDMSRRAAVLGAGAAVLARELWWGTSDAQAGFVLKNANDVVRCINEEKGEVESYDPPKDDLIGVCSNTEKDKACRENGDDYFDYDTNQCDVIDMDDVPCFLTTACVENIGLDDECFELSSLRAFRDKKLIKLPGGTDAIEAYYRTAPGIVAKLNASPNRQNELSRLYVRYILPSVIAAKLGLDVIAFRIYRNMMLDLYERFDSHPVSGSGRFE